MKTSFGQQVWFDGTWTDFDKATINVCSHVVHYGSNVFEGLRCYMTPQGGAIFRLREHMKRLYDSAKIYRMDIPYSIEALSAAVCETVRKNKLEACYIRPFVFRGLGVLGVNPLSCPIHVCIAAWEWGAYLGADCFENGIDVKISSWNRIAPNTFPALAKAGGNYLQSQLMKMEALLEGYAEALILDVHGNLSEGSGENVFLVRDGVLYTPSKSSSILPGITRDCVIKIARDMGIEVREESLARESIYIADEAFFTGTAAEISPIRSVDKITIGEGKRGELTAKIQKHFFGIVQGEIKDPYGWLSYL